jgi:glycosyltransferase involved in cell wall biosynthesis
MRYISLMWQLRPRIVQGCLHYANLIARVARPFCPPHALITSARAAYLAGEIRSERLTHWMDDGLIVNSPHIAQQVIDHASRPVRKVHNIANAIQVERFASNPQPTMRREIFPDAAFVIGVVGRIARQKDHSTLLEALNLTRSTWPSGLKVFFLGDCSEPETQTRLNTLIVRYDFGNIVHQFPVTSDVAPYYHMADIIVLPSLYEGFPNVILEAFAASKPVIVSTDADAVEIVKSGISGWRFPTGDMKTLAHCLQEAWNLSTAQLSQMGERARLEAENYSVEAMVKHYVDLYEKLITKRTR